MHVCTRYVCVCRLTRTSQRPPHPQDGKVETYTEYAAFEADYKSGKIHPGDLKPAVTQAINSILEPVRKHFETDPEAKKLLQQVKAYKTTR